MQFQVPQFVEVEDKILGPLTALQFAYVAGGGGFLFAMWLILPLWLAILIGGPVALLGAGLAFYKINDRPLMIILEAGFHYLRRTKLYIWAKKTPKIAASEDILLPGETQREDPAKYVPSATANKIKDLAWSLDIKESVYSDKEQQ
jgi:hypothetical protein